MADQGRHRAMVLIIVVVSMCLATITALIINVIDVVTGTVLASRFPPHRAAEAYILLWLLLGLISGGVSVTCFITHRSAVLTASVIGVTLLSLLACAANVALWVVVLTIA